MTATRLTPEDWIRAGFRSLVKNGAVGLKAEALARDLGTTKGSFYWHFKDVPAFHQAMLSHWEDKAFAGIVDSLTVIPSPTTRLRMLAQMATEPTDEGYGGIAAEPALRAWAHHNHTVADALAKVDGQRLEYLTDLLAELDVTNPDFARMIYGALIGMEDLSTRDQLPNEQPLETLIDLVLALR